jgi:ABC-2 type transport system ATP-binding protein
VAALLGPNGSGKSTVMRIITGYFSPTAGRVCIDGRDVGTQGAAGRSRIGYLPEQVALYPELSVRRYLAFVAEVKGLAGRARRQAVGEVLERCSLTDVADKLTGKLSKGYRQRVGLAQALLGDPEVLVLDEPTVGLDPMQTVEMRALLRMLSGRTVLLSTHILSEASALCSKIVILVRGRLIAEDTADGLGRRVARASRLTVRIDGPADRVASVLGGLAGVSGVERLPGDGRPGVPFAVVAPDPEPVQRALATTVVAHGWALLEVRATTPTLEDLFVHLVAQPDAGTEARP